MNNELIKIKNENGKQLVSARELYRGLGLARTKWTPWHNKNIVENEYFLENKDWARVSLVVTGNETIDFVITLEFAKHLAMMARTEKSHEYRNYFIQCEEKLKEMTTQPSLPRDYLSALKALVASEEEKELMKPKVAYYESTLRPDTYIKLLTSSEVAKDLGLSAQKLHTKLHELGIIYKQNKTWMLYSKYQNRVPEYCDYIINEHSQTLKWTEKGREWIISLLKEDQYIHEQKKNYLIG